MPRRLFEDLVVSGAGRRTARAAGALPLSLLAHAVAAAGALCVPALVSHALPDPVAPPPPRPAWPPVVVRPAVYPVEAVVRRTVSRAPQLSPARHAPDDRGSIPVGRPPTPSDAVLDERPVGETGGLCFDKACAPGGETGDPDAVGGTGGDGSGDRAPMRITSELRQPAKLRHVNPVYPDLAQRAGVEGKVVVDCVIDPSGHVADVRVVKGPPLLTTAAVEAVRQWVYSPTLLNHVPVSVILTVTVDFKLRR
jgi:protein TonB